MLAPATISTSISQRQWLHLQSSPNTMSATGPAGEMPKKRRILQPYSHNQQQHLRPHSGISVTPPEVHHSRKPPPPTLMIPFFDRREISTSSLSVAETYDEDAISPRTMPPTATNTDTNSKLVLRPCHVCHRKPSTKIMLDAYADCELCGQRACYICLRECNALNCAQQRQPTTTSSGGGGVECFDTEMGYHDDHHPDYKRSQRKVCSLCAIEGLTDTGQEIVWCVDCVRREGVSH